MHFNTHIGWIDTCSIKELVPQVWFARLLYNIKHTQTCTQNVRVDSDLRGGTGEPRTGPEKGEVGGIELENLHHM